jgi:hypothetical protein
MPPQPAQQPADDRRVMPAPLHDRAARRPQPIAKPRRGRRVKGVLAAAGLLMQEVRASQAHTDLGMIAEVDQLRLLIRRAAAPAPERLAAV